MSMIEKVARALCSLDVADYGPRQQYVDNTWRDYIPDARAAIEAMRDPTSEMCVAMLCVLLDEMEPGTLPPSIPAAAMLNVAIKAALSEGEG